MCKLPETKKLMHFIFYVKCGILKGKEGKDYEYSAYGKKKKRPENSGNR